MHRVVSGPCVPSGSGWGALLSPVPPRVLVLPCFVTSSACLISPGFILLTGGFYQIGRNVKITKEFSPESRAKEGGRLLSVHHASHSDHTPCTCRRWLATLYLSVSIAPAQLERVAHLLAPLMPWKVGIHITIVILQRGAASYPKLYPWLLTSSRVLHPIVPPFFLGCQTWPCEHRHHLVSGVPEDLSGLPRCPLRCGPPPALHLCPTAVTCVVCYIPEVKSLSW